MPSFSGTLMPSRPLSLDETYLDVTENKTGLPTATLVAKAIRQQIREELNLTASAGVAPNKFLAKIASDWKKPNGLFVIQPHEVQQFLLAFPVGRIPGVGKVTESRLKQVGVTLVGDLYAMEMTTLEQHLDGMGSGCLSWPGVSTIIRSLQIACASKYPRKIRFPKIFRSWTAKKLARKE